MRIAQALLLILVCAVLVGSSIGSIAQDPHVSEGPEPGTSKVGASIVPENLPETQAIAEEVPRGSFETLRNLVTQPAPAGPPGQITEDASALSAAPSAPTLTTNFDGIHATGWFPPDPVIAAGPNHLIQAVNASIRISTKSGLTLSTASFASWWSPVFTGTFIFDPQVLYDQDSDRWVLLTVARADASQRSWYLLSTSKTPDPTGEWCVWALDATLDGATPSSNWADFPKLGLDDQALYVTSNQFTFPGFLGLELPQYGKLRVMEKGQFYDNTCGPIRWWDFWNMKNADEIIPVFALQPAHSFGGPGKEYLINAHNPILADSVTVWSVTNPATTPTLTREATLPVAPFHIPASAEQLGSTFRIDTGLAYLTNAVYRNGSLYSAQTVPCFLIYSCARFLRIDVAGPTVTLDETYGAAGSYYFYPVIMPDPSGNMVAVFSRSSASEFAGVRYTSRRAMDPAFQASAALKAGAASYVQLDGFGRNRWGDYSGSALDPVDPTRVWVNGEFADSPANTWGTWVGEVDSTSGEPPVPCPASTVLGNASEGNSRLTTLYRFRDEVMAGSPEGRRYIRLYYRHAREGSWLLLRNHALRQEARGVLTRILPTLQAVLAGRPAKVTPADALAVERLMDRVSAEASSELRRAVARLRADLRRGAFSSLLRTRVRAGISTRPATPSAPTQRRQADLP